MFTWQSSRFYGALLICVVISNNLAGQWKAVSYKTITTVKWDISAQANVFMETGVCFPGNRDCRGVTVNESIQLEGKKYKEVIDFVGREEGTLYGKEINLPGTMTVNYDSSQLNLGCFTKNVKKIILVLQNDSTWYFKDITIKEDGFQLPFSSFIGAWETGDGKPSNNKTISLNRCALLFYPVNAIAKPEVVIGQLTIDEASTLPTGNVFAWVDSLTGQPRETYTNMLDNYSKYYHTRSVQGQQDKLVTFEESFGRDNGYLSGYVNFVNTGNANEAKLVEKLLKKFSELYPFYRERGIDKQAVQADIRRLFSRPGRQYAEVLAELRSRFKQWFPDPHLDIILPPANNPEGPKLKNGPLRLRKMGDDIIIAAVLNEQYQDSIPLGAKVISVNGQPSNALNDLNRVLQMKETDTLNIRVQVNSDGLAKTFRIPYSTPLKVGKNFVPVPGVEKLPDSILVFRISRWQGEDYYKFINAFYNRQHIKGVVVDLRGNGGGYSDEVLQVLSLFTDYTYSLGRRHYPWFDESIVISPANPIFQCPSTAKVIVLVDKGTACASEIFTLGIKRRPNTFVIGESPTMGAIASPSFYRFPSGLTLQLHTCFRQFVFDPLVYTEGKGIEPDIWISRTHARDLFPYEDKYMKAALQFIRLGQPSTTTRPLPSFTSK